MLLPCNLVMRNKDIYIYCMIKGDYINIDPLIIDL